VGKMMRKSAVPKSNFAVYLIIGAFVIASAVGIVLVAKSKPSSRDFYIGIGTLLVTVVLASVNAIYAYFMREVLVSEGERDLLSFSPTIGIEVGDISTSTNGIELPVSIMNGGNAVAIDVRIDADVILKCALIEGYSMIPSFFQPISVPFMFNDNSQLEKKIYFGPSCLDALRQDIEMCTRRSGLASQLMTHASELSLRSTKGVISTRDRIRLARKLVVPRLQRIFRLRSSGYTGTRIWHHMETFIWDPEIQVVVYYRNHVGQFFRSSFSSFITIPDISKTSESEDQPVAATDAYSLCEAESDRIIIVASPPIHQQKFSVDAFSEQEIKAEIFDRDYRRGIGGSCVPCVSQTPWESS